MMQAMCDAAERSGVELIKSDTWQRQAPVMMCYGLGHVGRRPWIEEHLRKGGRLIGWDLGYWRREDPGCQMRLTIDADHPHKLIGPETPERFDSQNIKLREDYCESGPIILCGLGRKQRAHKKLFGQEWEFAQVAKLRREYPRRDILYRPKRPEDSPLGLRTIGGGIEEAIRGASLVVCHHSNVAVDACIAGVPVLCEDGAAYALYKDNPKPTREQRLEFLRSLAHWQYTTAEAPLAWWFIKQKLGERK